ncbi:hypothetical protein BDF20DRAFT_385931 [Mycotypha africana]|uniref:uncharacterized protein n=1 Tax=Mycotypha africana TaxID=64632 RepID=UPI002301D4B4|nr:uncharacterized protein BDF20DRAFT_385931 [Mycotypha africana]KAI8984375.1 hypothetical protein BDF20DRAFT_385931 [Mycotypha africana]
MYTYYRTGSYSTNIQRILQGSISSDRSNDLILIKDYSLEWLSINSVAENHIPLLRTRLCQPTLGTIIDAQLLTCHLEEKKPEASTEFLGPEVLNKKQPYAKTVRKHSLIRGNDVIVMLSEYGKLVFLTIINNESLERPRFETLSEIYLDSPGLEYNKRGRKLAIDPR